MVPFSFSGKEFALASSNAIYWPRESALLVADLHLEKASFYAKHGQMLPPYDSRETLERIAFAIRQTGARRVYSLGDNFHDNAGASRLEPYAAGMLRTLTKVVDWVWITGNHDSELSSVEGGSVVPELDIADVILRHEAKTGETRPELSGHFHPRIQLTINARRIRRPCAVIAQLKDGANRMILPAFGAFTGGMNAADPIIRDALQPSHSINAVLAAGTKLLQFPLWQEAA
ncbi:ligase-associated DNA damage response endonuclease PdeM [Altererythrobacter indicus]|uniref:Ligase-associated DNA damage response endonuclease PdeM n=1 Tax=Altericroceibacterium indicum TaxID=374177 RepID=A0A845ABD1_9SPHN|nr:ligase-associated DNA damage response endonuclease PdeM [Altericroceibacterium indicum]MXP26679.1 ligase-associated DNA damage response endonuclease PdeM [Altericroceibacterium indicum]